MLFLPSDPATLAKVNDFGLTNLAKQLQEMGVGYFVGACMVGPRKREINMIAMRFGFSSPPNMTLLQVVLGLMCLVNVLTAVGLVVMMAT